MTQKICPHTFLIALTILFALLVAGCSSRDSEPPTPTPLPEPTDVPKPVYTVQQGDVTVQLSYDAQVYPIAETQLFFTVTGKVKEVFVNPGDIVTRGQVLAVLDTAQEEQELAAVEADLGVLEAVYEHDHHKAELAMQIAQMTLDLYKEQNRSEQEIKIQELQVELAQIDLDEVVEPPELKALRARAAELHQVIDHASLLSPADDHVLFVLLSSGRVIDPETPVLSLGDPSRLEVRGRLSSVDLESLKEGMPAVVEINAKNYATAGRVAAIPPPYGSGGDDYTHIQFDGADPAAEGFEIMSWVRATIIIDRHENALWLPPEAINDIGGRIFVFIQEGESTRRVDIKLGLVTADRVEILEGLSEGQMVVVP